MVHRKGKVDFTPSLAAIVQSKTQVDFAPVIFFVFRELCVKVHVIPLLAAMDVTPVLEATEQSRTQVDFAPAIDEIRYVSTKLHFAPLLAAMEHMMANLTFRMFLLHFSRMCS